MTTTTRETRRDRLALAREAGFGRFSLLAAFAGMLVAFGAFAVIAAIAGAVLEAVDANANVADNDWATVSAVGGAVLALVLFLSYFFGGYVAGRMARRSGLVNGLAVFLLGIVVAAVVGGIVGALSDTDQIQDNLRNVGVPTTADDWNNLGTTIGGVAALVLMLLGAVLGAMKGERWHGKLIDRALDPEYGPDAARRRAATRDQEPAVADWRTDDQRHREADHVGTGAVAAGDDRTMVHGEPTVVTGQPVAPHAAPPVVEPTPTRAEHIDLRDEQPATGGSTSVTQTPAEEHTRR